jgi:GT2 family glycosyltransferase
MDVTIAIPTYFGNSMVLNCVASIMAKVTQPKVIVYKNDIGWLQACNKLMQETPGDIILLNDDTVILTDIVREMSELAYSKPEIGIVGGVSLQPSGDAINNYGIYVGTDGNTAHKHYGKSPDMVRVEEQKAVEGSCMYIKREVIDKIGVFDPEFGMGYREEVDYCFRAREAGYLVVSSPKARYIHYVNQTHSVVGITNDKYAYFMSKWSTKLKLGKV